MSHENIFCFTAVHANLCGKIQLRQFVAPRFVVNSKQNRRRPSLVVLFERTCASA